MLCLSRLRCIAFLALGLVFIGAIAGCSDGHGSVSTTGGSAGTSTPRIFDNAQFTLSSTKTTFAQGESVPLTFTVANIGGQTITISNGGCELLRMRVTYNGHTIYQSWSSDLYCDQDPHTTPISPGNSATFPVLWPGTSSPGTYQITTWVTGYSGAKAPTNIENDLSSSALTVTVK